MVVLTLAPVVVTSVGSVLVSEGTYEVLPPLSSGTLHAESASIISKERIRQIAFKP